MDFTHLNNDQLTDLRFVLSNYLYSVKRELEHRSYTDVEDLRNTLNDLLQDEIKSYLEFVEGYLRCDPGFYYMDLILKTMQLKRHYKFIAYITDTSCSFLVDKSIQEIKKTRSALTLYIKQNKLKVSRFDFRKREESPEFKDVEFVENPHYV